MQLKFQTGEQAEAMVWMSLERLGRAHLLGEKVTKGRQVITRREMLKVAKMAGIAVALLPVVATITVPTAAATVIGCQCNGQQVSNLLPICIAQGVVTDCADMCVYLDIICSNVSNFCTYFP